MYITKFFMLGIFALDNHENVDVNAGKVGNYRQLAIKTVTICEKNRQQSSQMSTLKKWFTQIWELFSMINQTNTKIKTGRDQQAASVQNRILPCSAQTEWGHSAQPPSIVNISIVVYVYGSGSEFWEVIVLVPTFEVIVPVPPVRFLLLKSYGSGSGSSSISRP